MGTVRKQKWQDMPPSHVSVLPTYCLFAPNSGYGRGGVTGCLHWCAGIDNGVNLKSCVVTKTTWMCIVIRKPVLYRYCMTVSWLDVCQWWIIAICLFFCYSRTKPSHFQQMTTGTVSCAIVLWCIMLNLLMPEMWWQEEWLRRRQRWSRRWWSHWQRQRTESHHIHCSKMGIENWDYEDLVARRRHYRSSQYQQQSRAHMRTRQAEWRPWLNLKRLPTRHHLNIVAGNWRSGARVGMDHD